MNSLCNYVRIPHCSLCGQRFDGNTAFRSVILRDIPDCDLFITRSIRFPENSHSAYLEELDIRISKHPQRKAKYAPSVHSSCGAVGVDLLSLRTIYNLGIAMTPLVWAGLPQEFYRSYALSEARHSLLEASQRGEGDTVLCELLKRCGNLPVELTIIVWDFLTPGTVRCLLALNAAKRIWSNIPLSVVSATVPLHGEIVVYYTDRIKETYVCGIRQGNALYGHESRFSVNVPVPASSAVCISSLGTYGLQKMEFLTEAETDFTDMIDQAMDARKLACVVPCRTEKPLSVEVDWDLWKISSVSPHDKSFFGHDFLWVPPVPYGHLCLLSPDLFYNWPRHFDFATQSQRLMAYIPLREGNLLYGLTAFCSDRGFVGLGVHFSSRGQDYSVHWYGKQEGCPIHIQLDCSDTISSVHVYWHTSDFGLCRYLAVTTIRQRTFFLGPHFSPSKTGMETISGPDDGDILGLYYDVTPGITSFTSMGAICRPRNSSMGGKHEQSLPQMPISSDMTYFLNTSPLTSFFSQAPLRDIELIKACYVDYRCTGMLLCYTDNKRCILGQWYESTRMQPDIQEMFLQHDEILRFYFARDDQNQLVTHVKALPDTAPVETEVVSIDIVDGDEIIWMFSGDHDIIYNGSE